MQSTEQLCAFTDVLKTSSQITGLHLQTHSEDLQGLHGVMYILYTYYMTRYMCLLITSCSVWLMPTRNATDVTSKLSSCILWIRGRIRKDLLKTDVHV